MLPLREFNLFVLFLDPAAPTLAICLGLFVAARWVIGGRVEVDRQPPLRVAEVDVGAGCLGHERQGDGVPLVGRPGRVGRRRLHAPADAAEDVGLPRRVEPDVVHVGLGPGRRPRVIGRAEVAAPARATVP